MVLRGTTGRVESALPIEAFVPQTEGQSKYNPNPSTLLLLFASVSSTEEENSLLLSAHATPHLSSSSLRTREMLFFFIFLTKKINVTNHRARESSEEQL